MASPYIKFLTEEEILAARQKMIDARSQDDKDAAEAAARSLIDTFEKFIQDRISRHTWATPEDREEAANTCRMVALKAIEKFDPSRGAKLITYLYPTVNHHIVNFRKTSRRISDREIAADIGDEVWRSLISVEEPDLLAEDDMIRTVMDVLAEHLDPVAMAYFTRCCPIGEMTWKDGEESPHPDFPDLTLNDVKHGCSSDAARNRIKRAFAAPAFKESLAERGIETAEKMRAAFAE